MYMCMCTCTRVCTCVYVSNTDSFLSHPGSQEEMLCWPQAKQPYEPGQEEIYLTGAPGEIPRDIQ